MLYFTPEEIHQHPHPGLASFMLLCLLTWLPYQFFLHIRKPDALIVNRVVLFRHFNTRHTTRVAISQLAAIAVALRILSLGHNALTFQHFTSPTTRVFDSTSLPLPPSPLLKHILTQDDSGAFKMESDMPFTKSEQSVIGFCIIRGIKKPLLQKFSVCRTDRMKTIFFLLEYPRNQ